MLQALHAGNRAKRMEFSYVILWLMEDDNFLPRLIFDDKATFYISSKVKLSQCLNMGTLKSRRDLEYYQDFPKVNRFCAISLRKV